MFRLKIKYLKHVSTVDQIEIEETKTIGDIKNYAKGKHTVLEPYNLILIFNGKIHKDELEIRNCLMDDRTVFITLLKTNTLDVNPYAASLLRPENHYSGSVVRPVNPYLSLFNTSQTNSFQQTLERLLMASSVPNYETELNHLADLGFTDRRRNLALLRQYQGNLDVVASILLDNMVDNY